MCFAPTEINWQEQPLFSRLRLTGLFDGRVRGEGAVVLQVMDWDRQEDRAREKRRLTRTVWECSYGMASPRLCQSSSLNHRSDAETLKADADSALARVVRRVMAGRVCRPISSSSPQIQRAIGRGLFFLCGSHVLEASHTSC